MADRRTDRRTDGQNYNSQDRAIAQLRRAAKTVHPMLSDRCLVCPVLYVTLVYCCQTVARIKTKVGTQVGFSLGHTVLDRDPVPSLRKGAPPIFGPCLLWWPNGSMDQDATWYGGRPRPGDIVLDGAKLSPQKGHAPNFRLMSIGPNGRPSQLLLSSS